MADPRVTLGGNTVDTGRFAKAATLNEAETKSEDVAALPGIVGNPTADRLTLPVGEVVRIRWRVHDVGAPTGADDLSSIGYAFVVGQTAYTFVFSAPSHMIDGLEPTFEAILRSFWVRPGPSPTPAPADCLDRDALARHDAPGLEALLPARVANRNLAIWSVQGRCWLEIIANLGPSEVDPFVAQFESQDHAGPVDLANLAYAVGGRADTGVDPPYFVYGATRPQAAADIDLTLLLLFGGAGFHDVAAATDLRTYEAQTVSGKEVYMGTADMLDQDAHQRGRPYLYETDRNMFLIITDNPTWAADAIAQLP